MGVSVRYTIHSYSIWPNDALYVEALFGSSAFRAYCRPLGNYPSTLRLLLYVGGHLPIGRYPGNRHI